MRSVQPDSVVGQRLSNPASATRSPRQRCLAVGHVVDDDDADEVHVCCCGGLSSMAATFGLRCLHRRVCRSVCQRLCFASVSRDPPMTSLATWRSCRCRRTAGVIGSGVRDLSHRQNGDIASNSGSERKSILPTTNLCCSLRTSGHLSSFSAVILLVWCFANLLTSTQSAPPVIHEFLNEDRRVFQGWPGTSSVPFFNSLRVDARNESVIYVGAIDHVFRLNAENIGFKFEKSENLTGNDNYIGDYEFLQSACRRIGNLQNPEIQCRNHIRTVVPLGNASQLYVCSTGAYSPQEFILNIDTLAVVEVRSVASGRAKCPYDPLSIYSFAYVESGNPYDIPSLYTAVATDSNSGYVAIIRPELQLNRSRMVNLLRTDPDPKWINTAESVYVVATFDIGQYVYYFFRELALESTAYCGKTYYSRVARVCKNDEGGSGLNMEHRFTSFLKARLVCSVITPASSIPYYFNDVHDVMYNTSSQTFYGLFMANSNGQWGSAVCIYHMDNVNKVFDDGAWIRQSKLESAWLRVSEEDVPRPRPGQCTGGSANFITSTLSFIKSHPLMMDSVIAESGSPVYYSKSLAFSRLEVDYERDYVVLYLYLQELQELHRIALWNVADGPPTSSPISVWKPFASKSSTDTSLSTVWSLTFHSVKQKKWLYVTRSDAVIQLSPSQCKSYEYCSDCVRDPYCGWNGHCDTFRPGYLQAVKSSNPMTVCGNQCTKIYERTGIVPGMSIEMNCSSSCRPDNRLDVTWLFSNSSGGKKSAVPVDVDVGTSNYALTVNGGLIILRVSAVEHMGTFQCTHNGTVLTQHTLTASACEFSENVRDMFTRDYEKWCKTLDKYYEDYRIWTCMKQKCLQSNCIPKASNCG